MRKKKEKKNGELPRLCANYKHCAQRHRGEHDREGMNFRAQQEASDLPRSSLERSEARVLRIVIVQKYALRPRDSRFRLCIGCSLITVRWNRAARRALRNERKCERNSQRKSIEKKTKSARRCTGEKEGDPSIGVSRDQDRAKGFVWLLIGASQFKSNHR